MKQKRIGKGSHWLCAVVLMGYLPMSVSLGAQAIPSSEKDDLFAGTEKFGKNATSVTELNMDQRSLKMVDGNNAPKAHALVLSVVRKYTYEKPGMYKMTDVDEYRRKLASPDWRCSVHILNRKTGDSTDICTKRRIDQYVEGASISVRAMQLIFIHKIRRPDPAKDNESTRP